MMLAPGFLSLQKQVFLVLCLMAGFSGSIIAGARGNQESPEDPLPQAAEQEAEDGSARNVNSVDENIRLRQDLEMYSRNVDPAHVQIEERRRIMRKKVMERFVAADIDNDGSLTLEEATEPLPQVARRFGRIDLNGDNVITLDELEAAQARDMERARVVVIHPEGPEAKLEPVKGKSKQSSSKSKEVSANKRAL